LVNIGIEEKDALVTLGVAIVLSFC